GPALGAVGRGVETAGTFAGGAIRPALKAATQHPPAGAMILGEILGGPKGAAAAAALAKAPAVIRAGIAGGRGALADVAAQATEQAAREAAARAAADAALAQQAGVYEAGERLTQPGPPALPPATGYQMPPAGSFAEEQRIAALAPETTG